MTDASEKKSPAGGQNGGGPERLKDNRPSPFVSRDRIGEFTEGLFKKGSMNTLDARGKGIQKRYRIGEYSMKQTA